VKFIMPGNLCLVRDDKMVDGRFLSIPEEGEVR
jgi:hypothetical protein